MTVRRAPAPCRRFRRGWWRADSGSYSIEMAIVAPIILLVLFGTIQTGMWFHARSVATSAAQVSVQASRVYDGSAGAGQSAGMAYISSVGGLDTPGVAVTRGGTQTTAVVTGSTTRLVPGVPLPQIRVQSTAAVERLTG